MPHCTWSVPLNNTCARAQYTNRETHKSPRLLKHKRFQSWAEPHFRAWGPGSWLQVVPSASLSLSFSLPHHLFPPLTWRCRPFCLIRSHPDHYLWHFANRESWTRLLLSPWMCSLWLTLLWCSPGRSLQRPPERKEVLPESNQRFQIMPGVEWPICRWGNKYSR